MRTCNMDAIGIVEAFESQLDLNKRCQIILHKAKIPTEIKAYKRYIWTVWFISGSNRYSILEVSNNYREVTDSEIEKNTKNMECLLLQELYKLCRSNELMKDLHNGEFTGFNKD